MAERTGEVYARMAIRADDVDLDRDRDLVERYQAGDADAFDDLYRRYFERLHGFCMRRVGDRHEAEELAQEAFVRALRAMPNFAGERRFYPWMTVIAGRLCIDHHRRHGRVEPASHIDLGSVDADHDAVFDAVDHDHLRAALERLAPRHREVLALREEQGLSYQQIADELDVPVSTVEALLHRARKALRREFLSVSGQGRWAALPVLGWLFRRATAVRVRAARVADAIPHLPALAAPAAAAGAAAVAIALLPAGSGTHHRVNATSVSTTRPAATAGATGAAVAPAVPATVTTSVPTTAAPTTTTATTSRPPVTAGPASVYVGSDSSHQAEQRADALPTQSDIGPAMVAIDPQGAVHDVLGYLPDPQKGVNR